MLRRVRARPSKRERTIIAAVVGLIVATLGVVFYPLLSAIDWSSAEWPKLADPPVAGLIEIAAVVIGGAVQWWYLRRARKHELVVLDETGIRYQSPLPQFLESLQPSWQHFWTEIRSAQILVPRLAHPNLAVIVLDAGEAQRKLNGVWAPEGEEMQPARSRPWALMTGAALKEELAGLVEGSTLVRYLRSRGIAVARKAAPLGAGFALESHWATLAVTVTLVALMAYALIDLVLNTETYAVKAPLALYVLAGFLVAAACAALIARQPLPRLEIWALSLLLGGAVGGALYPGLLRVNQLTDGNGLKPYQFTLLDHVVLEPDDKQLPRLVLRGYHEYWQQFRPGSRHELVLRRGGLGFWQLDRAPLNARMREFYASKR